MQSGVDFHPAMNLKDYQKCLEQISYGKRLPNALYAYRDANSSFGEKLDSLLATLVSRYEVNPTHNVIKFRLDELKVSFLAYPDFLDCPHPVLCHSVAIDIVTGKSRVTDYTNNFNPPVLHRKESLLPSEHPRRAEFEALTRTEEAEGLYRDTTTIGFKLNWEALLAQKRLTIEGHRLHRRESAMPISACPTNSQKVERHRTAITRYGLSKPVKTLLEHGLLANSSSFFDYGCGQGSDVKGLQALGYPADGWDPVFRPEVQRVSADIVNLGYVLNVIDDPAERLEALCSAYELARRVLIVSTLIQHAGNEPSECFRDGLLTRRNTFQKYFAQQELHQYIEDALETTAVPVALGVFYVFRDPIEQQDFLCTGTRRLVDWNQISSRLGLGRPAARAQRIRVDLYERNKELLDIFWATMLQLGRLPLVEEFQRSGELRQNLGSLRKAERLFLEKGGKDAWEAARETRRNDLLVYLGMSNFREAVPLRYLSASLQQDIRIFFGNYRRALSEGRELLFVAGDPRQIELASRKAQLGWQDERALYIHHSLLEKLPPLLRVYVGCASVLFGDATQADIIKLHKASGKVTFLVYDDFFGKPLPSLQRRIKVNLRTRWMEVFDHTSSDQLLYFKERFLSADHPSREQLQNFSSRLTQLGIAVTGGFEPNKAELEALLKRHGLSEDLNELGYRAEMIATLSDDSSR
ncbi:MAG: DNA phosphorothioation-associated putative methyltransferase [Acidobacteria bacterium]|nr:DNA phosphorothioation-associated putative methyltransferase [Acidobacteriota bacterium]